MTTLYLILFLAAGDTTTIETNRSFDRYEECAEAGEAELYTWRDGGLVRGFGCLSVTIEENAG